MTGSSPRPAAPDTTGELREQLEQLAAHKIAYVNTEQRWGRSKIVDAVLALPALRDLLAERDTLAAKVQAVEELATWFGGRVARGSVPIAELRRVLGTPTTGGGE